MVFSEDAFDAVMSLLKPLFIKALIVDLETLTCTPVVIDDKEYEEIKDKHLSLLSYLKWFSESELLHTDDKEGFISFIDALPSNNYVGHYVYKRLLPDKQIYHWMLLELMPTDNGTKRALYVKDIDYIYMPAYDNVIDIIGTKDHDTGLYNSLAYQRDCLRYINGPVGAIYMDVNGLKWTNDNLGHNVGNEIILKVAADIKNRFQGETGYKCYHLHGDEFLVLYFGDDLAQFILKANEYHRCLAKDLYVALGYAVSGTLSDSVRKAELDMYRDKTTYYALHPERAR